MNPVRRLRASARVTQAALAEAAGTSQPAIAAYEAGRKAPSLTTLERLARAVGLEASVAFHSPTTREDRRSLALHEAIADRLREQPDLVMARARDTLTRMLRHAPTSPALREWRVLLARPVSALADLLVDPSPWSRELRHVTPFAGVLSAAERATVYQRFAEAEAESRR